MAIWQFKLSLIPRLGILREHGRIPSRLDAFEPATGDAEELRTQHYPNYWEGVILSPNTLRSIGTVLPPMDSWSGQAKMFGFEHGHQLEIWENDFIVKLDMRDFDNDYLRKIVDLANELDCLLVLHENGHVVPPEYLAVLEASKQSQACRFVCDPTATLKDLGRKRKHPE